MYSDKDFQTFWFRYKTEGEPHGISINSFCINLGVPYKRLFVIAFESFDCDFSFLM